MSRETEKLARIRAEMKAQGVGLVALGPGAHMHWVLDWHPHPDERPTLLLIGAEEALALVPSVNAEQFGAATSVPLETWRDEEGPEAALARALDRLGAPEVVALDETMRTDFSLPVLAALPGARHVYAGALVGKLRMVKDAEEYAALKASARANDQAMQAGIAALRPGVTEKEVAQAIQDAFAAQGAQVAFALCASGPNGAYPHHSTGTRKLEAGDSVVLDIGAKLAGWPSDMTRMGAVGAAPEGYDEVHAVVEAALEAGMRAARPGARAHEVDDAARGVIEAAGYGEYFVHRTGHGLGLEVHEPPYLTSASEEVLKEGMVFSIEPGIYIPGRFGIRLEEIVILRAEGPEILSELPRTLAVV
ncbi:M24 family metallopeptidase [Roseivivax sp.]